MPLIERKALLKPLIEGIPGLQFNDHETATANSSASMPASSGSKASSPRQSMRCTHWGTGASGASPNASTARFVVVGWTDPEGSRPHLGALLLGYYTDDGRLIYAGRVGTGMPDKTLADLRRRLEPLARSTPPLSAPSPRKPRFGSPLVLTHVHWVEPQLVAEITYLTWTADGLLRHTSKLDGCNVIAVSRLAAATLIAVVRTIDGIVTALWVCGVLGGLVAAGG